MFDLSRCFSLREGFVGLRDRENVRPIVMFEYSKEGL